MRFVPLSFATASEPSMSTGGFSFCQARFFLALLLPILLLSGSACQNPDRDLPAAGQVDSTNTLTKNLLRLMRETDQLDSFIVALERTDMADEMAAVGPYTVFAPTNEAFSRIPARLDTLYFSTGGDSLRELVQYHMIYGRYDSSDVHDDTLRVSSVAQIPLTLRRSDASFQAGNQQVRRTINAQNGVLHLIPSLLSPPLPDTTEEDSFTIPDTTAQEAE